MHYNFIFFLLTFIGSLMFENPFLPWYIKGLGLFIAFEGIALFICAELK